MFSNILKTKVFLQLNQILRVTKITLFCRQTSSCSFQIAILSPVQLWKQTFTDNSNSRVYMGCLGEMANRALFLVIRQDFSRMKQKSLDANWAWIGLMFVHVWSLVFTLSSYIADNPPNHTKDPGNPFFCAQTIILFFMQ